MARLTNLLDLVALLSFVVAGFWVHAVVGLVVLGVALLAASWRLDEGRKRRQ